MKCPLRGLAAYRCISQHGWIVCLKSAGSLYEKDAFSVSGGRKDIRSVDRLQRPILQEIRRGFMGNVVLILTNN